MAAIAGTIVFGTGSHFEANFGGGNEGAYQVRSYHICFGNCYVSRRKGLP
jgi:hypothetical protein